MEFGLDSCATSHIVNDLSLFISGTIAELKNNGVKGIGRTVKIPLKGDVEIFIFCSDKKKHKHILRNVSYVLESPKNLISISQWKDDYHNDMKLRCKENFLRFF